MQCMDIKITKKSLRVLPWLESIQEPPISFGLQICDQFFWPNFFEGPSASLTKDVGKLEAITYPRRQVLPNESGTLGFQQV